jgi:hypothetical protein
MGKKSKTKPSKADAVSTTKLTGRELAVTLADLYLKSRTRYARENDCRHGAPTNHAEFPTLDQDIKHMLGHCMQAFEKGGNMHNLLMWFVKEYGHKANDRFVRHLQAAAVNYLVEYKCYRSCRAMMYCMKMAETIMEARGMHNFESTIDSFCLWVASTETDLEMMRYLGKRTPCSCVNSFKQALKQKTRTAECKCCHKIRPKQELLYCSECKTIPYCSAQCQKKHWPHHKELCQTFVRAQAKRQMDELLGRKVC